MNSKWSKLAVAAAIIIAVAIGLNVIPLSGHGVAWADVFQNVQRVRAYIHRTRLVISRDEQPPQTVEFTMYRSVDYGLRRDAYADGNLVTQLFLARDVEDCVEVVPSQKRYVKTTLSQQQRTEMREKQDPRELMKLFTSFDHTDLEPQMIDGKPCEGIEIDDPGFGRMVFERGKGRLWADVESELPVLMELEGTAGGGTIELKITLDQFEWNAPLTEEDFEPNIPDDYTVMAEVDLSANEQTLIKGLGRFAVVTGGTYPTSLDVMTSMQEVQVAFIVERRKQGVSMEQEPTKEEMDNILAIQGGTMYYAELMKEDCDLAWYGDKVTAEFPHAVLMRWRCEGENYRVIFADLSVREVTPQELADLEAAALNTEPHPIKPEPADGAVGTAIEGLQLRWLRGAHAVEHKVYFGTDPDKLQLLGTVKDAQFTDVPTLERDTTYYWHVDEVHADGSTTPGSLWSFSTGRLVGWWKLDETAGQTAADSSGNGHAGALVGDPAWTQGTVGGALEFDGEGDYVDLGTSPDFDMTSQVTVAAWIKVNTFDVDWQAIVGKGDTAWRLSRSQGDNVHFACTGMWPEWVHGSADVNDGQWHHVAGTYDGAELCLYVDGQLDVSATTSGQINVNDHPVTIGENAEHPEREWNGLIDDVRIYSYALSQAEIKALAEE